MRVLQGKGGKSQPKSLSGLGHTARCPSSSALVCEGCTQQGPAFPTDTMDFSGMSLIKLKKEEMETQVQP